MYYGLKECVWKKNYDGKKSLFYCTCSSPQGLLPVTFSVLWNNCLNLFSIKTTTGKKGKHKRKKDGDKDRSASESDSSSEGEVAKEDAKDDIKATNKSEAKSKITNDN